MPMKRYKPEQIVALLRQIEVEIANGKTTLQACKEAEIKQQTYYRWRKEFGGLKLHQVKRMKELDRGNTKPKRLVAKLTFVPFQVEEVTDAQLLQKVRGKKFAHQAAERIRVTENCLFSLLPHAELSRLAEEWYEACAQAMLRGNYAPIDMWIRSQSRLAATQGFAPEDLLELLHACRRSAIEIESWSEDIISVVDEVMEEVLTPILGNISWKIAVDPETSIDATSEVDAGVPVPDAEKWTSDRRRFTRNRLRFPIRVTRFGPTGQTEEFSFTESVSRGGLYFLAHRKYETGQPVKVTFPYWNVHDRIDSEYPAKVIRLDEQLDKTWGVGIDFVESLGRKV